MEKLRGEIVPGAQCGCLDTLERAHIATYHYRHAFLRGATKNRARFWRLGQNALGKLTDEPVEDRQVGHAHDASMVAPRQAAAVRTKRHPLRETKHLGLLLT
jgi:hypothetical protein